MNYEFFNTKDEWHNWLVENHADKDELWLVYYKKETGKEGISYRESLEEAICFGWIDGLLKKLDHEKYVRRFTPRKPKSIWSKINKDIALELITTKRMKPLGLQKVEEAKSNGNWDKAYNMQEKAVIPDDLKTILQTDKEAWNNFQNFTNSIQSRYIFWIEEAKREETRKRRLLKLFQLAKDNIKPTI